MSAIWYNNNNKFFWVFSQSALVDLDYTRLQHAEVVVKTVKWRMTLKGNIRRRKYWEEEKLIDKTNEGKINGFFFPGIITSAWSIKEVVKMGWWKQLRVMSDFGGKMIRFGAIEIGLAKTLLHSNELCFWSQEIHQKLFICLSFIYIHAWNNQNTLLNSPIPPKS